MPPKPERSAYDVLNLPGPHHREEIKKRYRELARQYHPDVNQGSTETAKKFAEVTTAYKTLSDPQSRATHDADLTLRERQAAQAAARQQAAAAARTGPSAARPTTTAPPPRGAATAASAAVSEAQRVVAEAQSAFARGKLVEARSLAEQAVRLNRRNVTAYEVLGDVYRLQGKTDEAMNMYTMVLQLDPRNQTVRQRFERLARVAGVAPGPSAQRVFFDNRGTGSDGDYGPRPGPMNGRGPAPSPASRVSDEKRSLGLFAVGFIGYAGTLMLILYTALFHGHAPMRTGPPLLGFISTWNGTIWTALAVCGLLLGATMTITGLINRIDDELILNRGGDRGPHLPVGLLVIVVSILNFYLAAGLYVVSALIQESFTRSMQRVFGAVVLVTGLLAAVYEPGHLQVLLWGGNVVFIGLVVGWLLGDFFRPEGT